MDGAMAVTRSTAVERVELRSARVRRPGWRTREFLLLAVAALAVSAGLRQVYRAKQQTLTEAEQGLAAKRLVNLNSLGAREDLLPALSMIPNVRERQETARQIYYLSGT